MCLSGSGIGEQIIQLGTFMTPPAQFLETLEFYEVAAGTLRFLQVPVRLPTES